MTRRLFPGGALLRLPLTMAATLLGMALLAGAAHAVDPVNASWLGGVAIQGIDPVAYFTQGRPVEGSKAFEHQWRGATWRFANAEHRDRFAADPERYAPKYGGYCAWAVSQGYTADIDPEAWTIVEGRLYLNYSKSVQARWAADMEARIRQADANWPKLLAEG